MASSRTLPANRRLFVIGDEARPRLLNWRTEAKHDIAIAEHLGYTRLPEPVTHRRTVEFHKKQRCWMIQDDLTGGHSFSFRFHFAPGLETKVRADGMIEVGDKMNGARLLIAASGVKRRTSFGIAILIPRLWS